MDKNLAFESLERDWDALSAAVEALKPCMKEKHQVDGNTEGILHSAIAMSHSMLATITVLRMHWMNDHFESIHTHLAKTAVDSLKQG